MDTLKLVVRFFELLNALTIEKRSELFADPNTMELTSYEGSAIVIHRSAVWHLFNYHSDILTLEMLDKDIVEALDITYDANTWSQYGRPTLRNIAESKRTELLFNEIISSL